MKNILMLSSSREGNTDYLAHATSMIGDTLADIDTVLFIPYAGVTVSYDDYQKMVQQALPKLKVLSIHQFDEPQIAVQNAEAILVGGGNTFVLLELLYRHKLLTPIKHAVDQGIPYIGWSAGSNICGASIRTTNDMPISQPESFDALNFVPLQINPHYSDYQAPGHNGETREQRLMEFSILNPSTPVIGIREGNALKLQNQKLQLIGPHSGVLIRDCQSTEIRQNADLSELLSSD